MRKWKEWKFRAFYMSGIWRWSEIIYSKHSHHIVIWRLPKQWHTKKRFHIFLLLHVLLLISSYVCMYKRNVLMYEIILCIYVYVFTTQIHDDKNNSNNIRSHTVYTHSMYSDSVWEKRKKRTLTIHIHTYSLFCLFSKSFRT